MRISIKKNVVLYLLYEIIKLIAPIITTPYVSRILGADGIGQYSFSYSVVTYFMLLGALGTSSYGTREIARARNDNREYSKLFWEIELMTVVVNIICLIGWLGLSIVVGFYSPFFIALTPFILSTMFDISWLFNGLERIKDLVIVNSLVRVMGVVALFTFVKKKEDILLYFIINSCMALAGSISMWLYLPRLLVAVSIKSLTFRYHFRETLLYFIPSMATSIYTVLDKTLIGLITGNSFQNGYYEQATKIINIVKTLVFIALNTVVTARLSYLFSQEAYSEIKGIIHKSLDIILCLGMGAIFGLLGISRRFVPFFLGDGFEPVVDLIYLMLPLVIIIGISNCLGSQYYTPSGNRTKSAKYIVVGALVNLALNLLLIPVLNAKGAVAASIVAELVITSLYIRNCENYIKIMDILNMLWRRIAAGIPMAIAVYMFGRINGNSVVILAIQIVMGFIIYGLILTLLKDDIMLELTVLITRKMVKKR